MKFNRAYLYLTIMLVLILGTIALSKWLILYENKRHISLLWAIEQEKTLHSLIKGINSYRNEHNGDCPAQKTAGPIGKNKTLSKSLGQELQDVGNWTYQCDPTGKKEDTLMIVISCQNAPNFDAMEILKDEIITDVRLVPAYRWWRLQNESPLVSRRQKTVTMNFTNIICN
ncbi:MAG: hypothetical protein ACLQF0_13280 [Dissulfurispiraceae bacterium]